LSRDELQSQVEALELTNKWLDGKTPKKIIVVPGKIVNIVV
jgi:leucyl-tRNA synthetase